MSQQTTGYIYILTNPSFPVFMKIGYADDVEKRLKELNRSECTPYAFRLFAYYEVNHRLTDLKIHNIIDKLNPNLRSIDNINGKKRIREFYAMSAEDAYDILYAIAEINGMENKMHLMKETPTQKKENETINQIQEEARQKLRRFSFAELGIKPGEILTFIKDSTITVEVIDDRKVSYNGQTTTLSNVTYELLHKGNSNAQYNGAKYFSYHDKTIYDLWKEHEQR